MEGIGYIKSPVGILKICAGTTFVQSISFIEKRKHDEIRTELVDECIHQLKNYFSGEKKVFTVPIFQEGTTFQQTVWDMLLKIPFGKTMTYKEIAHAIESPYSVRAVGNANAKNKIPIIVPCHRIIGSKGRLTGYSGGLWRKKWLLEHESSNAQQFLKFT